MLIVICGQHTCHTVIFSNSFIHLYSPRLLICVSWASLAGSISLQAGDQAPCSHSLPMHNVEFLQILSNPDNLVWKLLSKIFYLLKGAALFCSHFQACQLLYLLLIFLHQFFRRFPLNLTFTDSPILDSHRGWICQWTSTLIIPNLVYIWISDRVILLYQQNTCRTTHDRIKTCNFSPAINLCGRAIHPKSKIFLHICRKLPLEVARYIFCY